jgi:hypothetical protein
LLSLFIALMSKMHPSKKHKVGLELEYFSPTNFADLHGPSIGNYLELGLAHFENRFPSSQGIAEYPKQRWSRVPVYSAFELHFM